MEKYIPKLIIHKKIMYIFEMNLLFLKNLWAIKNYIKGHCKPLF